MTHEIEMLNAYIEEHQICKVDLADAFGYCRGSENGWFSGSTRVPLDVLLAIGFYLPAYDEEKELVKNMQKKLAEVEARRQKIRADADRKTAERASVLSAERSAGRDLTRRWCRAHGFITRKGACDIERAAFYFGISCETMAAYVYGHNAPSAKIAAKMRRELEEANETHWQGSGNRRNAQSHKMRSVPPV